MFLPHLRALIISTFLVLPSILAAETISADLLIAGGSESACAAAVQAARLGVKKIMLVNDIEWLGGQFSAEGVGCLDEWTAVRGKKANFPRSGLFMEVIQRIRAHNSRTYGVASPGNAWSGTPDRLPFKPYVREGLRLEALYMLREQDIRAVDRNPRWACPRARGSRSKKDLLLTRAECVRHLWTALQQAGEWPPTTAAYLTPGHDSDGDGINDLDDALPFDHKNQNLPDRLLPSAP